MSQRNGRVELLRDGVHAIHEGHGYTSNVIGADA
jgi:hypothetical protein